MAQKQDLHSYPDTDFIYTYDDWAVMNSSQITLSLQI